MTKDEKIQNYQTALNCLRHVENIFDKLNNNFPSKGGASYKQFLIARNNASVARDMILEDFINDTFTDCVSDCATVQTFYVNNPAPTAEYSGIPVILTKNKEQCYFPSYAEAARFLLKKFGVKDGWSRSSVYSLAIGKYFNEPNHPRSYLLHDYIPSHPNFKEC